MKCEICRVNQATRSIRRNVEGAAKELFVCDTCARTAPHAGSVPTSLTDVLFSLGMQLGGNDKIEDNVCPACGMSRNEVREKHRLGCPKCYDVFVTDIRTFLSEQQPVVPHAGKASDVDSGKRDVEKLKAELEKAVAEERFEAAAEICDKIRRANGQSGSDGKNG
jgi:protein arginine kinase activator